MAFCPKCGSPVEGRFCAKCGAPMEVNPGAAQYAPPPQYGAPQPQYAPPPPGAATGGLQENVACALCYSLGFITGILFLVLEPYSKNRTIRFHAFQAIFLSVAMVVIEILMSFVWAMSWGLAAMLSPLVGLAFFGLWIFMMYKAYNNQRVMLPVIGDLAQKQA